MARAIYPAEKIVAERLKNGRTRQYRIRWANSTLTEDEVIQYGGQPLLHEFKAAMENGDNDVKPVFAHGFSADPDEWIQHQAVDTSQRWKVVAIYRSQGSFEYTVGWEDNWVKECDVTEALKNEWQARRAQ